MSPNDSGCRLPTQHLDNRIASKSYFQELLQSRSCHESSNTPIENSFRYETLREEGQQSAWYCWEARCQQSLWISTRVVGQLSGLVCSHTYWPRISQSGELSRCSSYLLDPCLSWEECEAALPRIGFITNRLYQHRPAWTW